MPLANDSYRNLPTLTDRPTVLNLSWNLDERPFLDVDLVAVLAGELRAELDEGLPYVDSYLVNDPFGASHLEPAVGAYFGRRGPVRHVTCAAGVSSLLHAMAGLIGDGDLYVVGEVYPDLPHWVVFGGGGHRLRSLDPAEPLIRRRGGMILLDRPSPLSSWFDDRARVSHLCRLAQESDTLVVVDESYANYCPPGYSVVALTDDHPNLVVLRGLSKAYWLGSVRIGYAVCSQVLAARIRALITPMEVSSLSLRLAIRILGLGDITGGLRGRIASVRTEVVDLLAGRDLPVPDHVDHDLPHLVFTERAIEEGLPEHLATRGIQGKTQPFWSGSEGVVRQLFRLSLPLSEARLGEFRRRLDSPAR